MNRIYLKYGIPLGVMITIFYLIEMFVLNFRIAPEIRYLIYMVFYLVFPILAFFNVKKISNNTVTFSDTITALFATYFIGNALSNVVAFIVHLFFKNILIWEVLGGAPFLSRESSLMQMHTSLLGSYEGSGANDIPAIGGGFLFGLLIWLIIFSIVSIFLGPKKSKPATATSPANLD